MKSLFSYESHELESKMIPIKFQKDHTGFMHNFFNWHRELEFLYVVHGSGIFVSDANSFELSEGDIFAINVNSIHTVSPKDELLYHCMIVDAQFCIENGIPVDEITFKNKISDSTAAKLYKNIGEESEGKNDYSVAGIRTSVLLFMLHLVRNHICDVTDSHRKTGKKSIENMRNAIEYIRAHFTEKISLDDIAGRVGLSKCHFAREFKKLMGITPVGYINMLRCDTAMKMLSGGKQTVSEIQLSCGFDNASYFAKVFKKHFGKSPVEFLP